MKELTVDRLNLGGKFDIEKVVQIENRELMRAGKVICNMEDDYTEYHTGVVMKFYMSRRYDASVVYCTLRIHSPDGKCGYGVGVAGGWGYDKPSAALQEALNKAGVRLNRSIHGTGEVTEALKALGKALYPNHQSYVVEIQ